LSGSAAVEGFVDIAISVNRFVEAEVCMRNLKVRLTNLAPKAI
jgi:hypothetical protein